MYIYILVMENVQSWFFSNDNLWCNEYIYCELIIMYNYYWVGMYVIKLWNSLLIDGMCTLGLRSWGSIRMLATATDDRVARVPTKCYV